MKNKDLLIKNAVVRTIDDRDSIHSAILLRAGRIAALGTEVEMQAAASSGAEVFDAGGRTVVPGFIDAWEPTGQQALLPTSGGGLRAY